MATASTTRSRTLSEFNSPLDECVVADVLIIHLSRRSRGEGGTNPWPANLPRRSLVRRLVGAGGTWRQPDRSLFVSCEIERKNAPGSGSFADSSYFASGLPA